MKIDAPVSVGELVDKLTILRIKLEKIGEPAKLAHVRDELALLRELYERHGIAERIDRRDEETLQSVNRELWEVEDRLREHEARGDFGAEFVALARSVYRLNDARAAAKRRINLLSGSAVVEEKSYKGA